MTRPRNGEKLQFDAQIPIIDAQTRHLALLVRSGPTYVGLSNLIRQITRLRK